MASKLLFLAIATETFYTGASFSTPPLYHIPLQPQDSLYAHSYMILSMANKNAHGMSEQLGPPVAVFL